jgi:hypothetical protein
LVRCFVNFLIQFTECIAQQCFALGVVHRPGSDLKDTPRGLLSFDDDGQGAIGLNLILLLVGLIVLAICQKSISRASFAHAVVRAKTMGNRVVQGGKVRTI